MKIFKLGIDGHKLAYFNVLHVHISGKVLCYFTGMACVALDKVYTSAF